MRDISKILLIFSMVFVLTCSDLGRDNPLDPRNPNSERTRIVLVEAFVNDDPAASYCDIALDGLAQLEANFGTAQLIILEYHYLNGLWQDEYALQDANDRYNELADTNKGIPDVFFNGADSRVQGAYTAENEYQRYRQEFEDESTVSGLYTIETSTSSNSGQIAVSVLVARLGNVAVRNISLNAVVVENCGTARHLHVVRSVLAPYFIDNLDAGELAKSTFTIDESMVTTGATSLVLFIYDENASNKKVLQAMSLDL